MSLRLNGSNSGFSEITAPATAGDNTLTLPTGNGSANQFLKNSGTAGTLEFAALAGSNMPAGSILQVQSVTKTDRFSTSNSSQTDVTGLSVTITPTSATTKMLLLASIGLANTTTDDYAVYLTFGLGGSTLTAATGDAEGSRRRTTTAFRVSGNHIAMGASFNFLHDHDSSSNLTYSVQVGMDSGGGNVFINRTGADDNSAIRGRGISTLTVMEVAV